MTDAPEPNALTKPAERQSNVSVAEKSDLDLVAAIRGEADRSEIDAMILAQAETLLLIGYVPDWTDRQKMEFADEFRVALRDLPVWAVKRAFLEWKRTNPRRPSPAEVRILAQRALTPITDEIERRKRAAAEAAATRRPPVSKARADAIMAEAGFDPERTSLVRRFPQAATIQEAEEKRDAPPAARHWTDSATPEQMEVMRKSRDENANVQAARAMSDKASDGGSAA